MAKDKTRERKLPSWLGQRKALTLRAAPETVAYYGLQEGTKFLSWFDCYGTFRRDAKVSL